MHKLLQWESERHELGSRDINTNDAEKKLVSEFMSNDKRIMNRIDIYRDLTLRRNLSARVCALMTRITVQAGKATAPVLS